jgi:hypothetical protein
VSDRHSLPIFQIRMRVFPAVRHLFVGNLHVKVAIPRPQQRVPYLLGHRYPEPALVARSKFG